MHETRRNPTRQEPSRTETSAEERSRTRQLAPNSPSKEQSWPQRLKGFFQRNPYMFFTITIISLVFVITFPTPEPLDFVCQAPLVKNWARCRASGDVLTKYDNEALRTVVKMFNDVQDIALKSNGLARIFFQEVDHMDVIRLIVQQSKLPDPVSIIGATNKLDIHATETISMLREFLPEARNCDYLFKTHLALAVKSLESIERTRNRRRFWLQSLLFGYDGTRKVEKDAQEVSSILEVTIGIIEQLRQFSEKLLVYLTWVRKGLRDLDVAAGSNRKLINEDNTDKKQVIPGSCRYRPDMKLIEGRLCVLDELDSLVTQGGQATRALYDAIETIRGDLEWKKTELMGYVDRVHTSPGGKGVTLPKA
ncbi:hypothetical protein PG988_015513 [Apiospora saccharicola]